MNKEYFYGLELTFCAGSDDEKDTDKGNYIIRSAFPLNEAEVKHQIKKTNRRLANDESGESEYSANGLNIATLIAGVNNDAQWSIENPETDSSRPTATNFKVEQWW